MQNSSQDKKATITQINPELRKTEKQTPKPTCKQEGPSSLLRTVHMSAYE